MATNLTWHIWQTQLADPDEVVQYAAPEDGVNRSDGAPWTDDYPTFVRGGTVGLTHVGTASYPAMGAYGPSDAMAATMASMAPAGLPVASSVAVTFALPDDDDQDADSDPSEPQPEAL